MAVYPIFKDQDDGSKCALEVSCFQKPFENKYGDKGNEPMIQLHHLYCGKESSSISLNFPQVEALIELLTRWKYTETTEALEEENQKLREALEFYADERHYKSDALMDDCGNRAREVLGK